MRSIHFSELRDFNSGKHLVITGLAVKDDEHKQETIAGMNEFFTKNNLFLECCKVVDLIFVEGNVKGKDGRSDWLMELSTGVHHISPLKRLEFGRDIKWLDDFIVNFEEDYNNFEEDYNV